MRRMTACNSIAIVLTKNPHIYPQKATRVNMGKFKKSSTLCGGRYWIRTNDLLLVRQALYTN